MCLRTRISDHPRARVPIVMRHSLSQGCQILLLSSQRLSMVAPSVSTTTLVHAQRQDHAENVPRNCTCRGPGYGQAIVYVTVLISTWTSHMQPHGVDSLALLELVSASSTVAPQHPPWHAHRISGELASRRSSPIFKHWYLVICFTRNKNEAAQQE